MRTKLALIGGAMVLILVVLMAQPVPVIRVLRDLQDVKPSVPPGNGDALIYNSASGKWTNGTASGSGGGITNSGVGTNNYLAKWTGTNSLGTSAVSDDATTLKIGEAGRFAFDIASGSVAFGNDFSFNTNAGVTFDMVGQSSPFDAIALSSTGGPYIRAESVSQSGGHDDIILGKDSQGGGTKRTQRIITGAGSTDGYQLELRTTSALDGSGGKLTIQAADATGIDHDGGDVSIRAGNATGTGSVGNVILIAGTGGSVESFSPLSIDTLTASTLVRADANKFLTSIANAVGIATNDGSGNIGWSTNITQDITINNFTVTNLTIQSNLVVNQSITLQGKKLGSTHLNGTNIFPVVNFTNSATVTWAYDGTSNITATASSSGTTVSVNATNVSTPNIQDTSSVTWAISGSNITATAAGMASTWVPVTTLTFSTTNVTIPCNGGTNFVVTLTNSSTGYFNASGTPSSASTNTTFTLTVIQDGTGTRAMNWDTSVFHFQGGVVPIITTNANAEDVFTISSSAKTAGKMNVTQNIDFK